jgi:hypothetical protein
MNTFKEPDRYDEKNKNGQNQSGRKTRSPAPEVKKQGKEQGGTRTRTGENLGDTQFTDGNN